VQFSHLVKQTLRIALQQLRYIDKHRYLWVDAICINQDDSDEKSDQVHRMGQTYKCASKVCIWLGLNSQDTALNFFANWTDNSIYHLVNNESSHWAEMRIALVSLFNNPWFGRRWILQEMAFARRTTFYLGAKQLEGDMFIGAMRNLSKYDIRAELERREIESRSVKYFWRSYYDSGAR
jgi:hypothetical protein